MVEMSSESDVNILVSDVDMLDPVIEDQDVDSDVVKLSAISETRQLENDLHILKNKPNTVEDRSDTVKIAPNLCSSLDQWNRKGFNPEASKNPRPPVKVPVKRSKQYSQRSPDRSPLTKKICKTGQQKSIASCTFASAAELQLAIEKVVEVSEPELETDSRKDLEIKSEIPEKLVSIEPEFQPLESCRLAAYPDGAEDYLRGPAVGKITAKSLVKDEILGDCVPQPLNLNAEKKRKREEKKPTQPQGYNFDRFRRSSCDVAAAPFRLTLPQAPNLRTKLRKRNVQVLSAKEKEDQELEEMKKHQFKAIPVNKRVLNEVENLKPVPAKRATVVEPFKLTNGARRSRENLGDETFVFRAQPIPRAVFNPVKLPPKPLIKHTIPVSPSFTLKKNTDIKREFDPEQVRADDRVIRVSTVPDFSQPFRPTLPHRYVEPEPFSFEEHIKESLAKKEEAFQRELEKEAKAREFFAQALPDLAPVKLVKVPIPVTEPVPFQLSTYERGIEKEKRFKEKVEEEQQKQHEATLFKAQPAVVLHTDPFVPQLPHKVDIEFEPFVLHTEERFEQRREWEMKKRKSYEDKYLATMEEERKKKEREDAEVQRMREEIVHHANPIRRYKPVEPKAAIPLTKPQSPNFSERLNFKK